MASFPSSKVFKRYADLGCVVEGSFKKRSPDVLIEHAYAKFPHSKHAVLLLLPSLQQMEHGRFMRTVLAMASSTTPREFRFKVKAGLLLVIPPDEWIDAAENFKDIASSTKFSLPVVEQWLKTFPGGIHRQSSTPIASITKARHEMLARQFEQDVHQDELFRGDRVSDPPFESTFFDELCANVEVLNKRFDQKADAVRKAKSAAKRRRGTSVGRRAVGANGAKAPLEWLDLQQANGAVDFVSASVDTGRRAVLQMSTPPIYAANTEGSVFSDRCRHFNLANLGTMLDHHPTVPGVNRPPYLYVGMKSTMAPWFIEDGRLYSIFYLHAKSAHKFWYSVDASKSREFEKVMGDLFPLFRQKCRRFLDHKEFFAAPELLMQKGLPVNVLVQLESTFTVTLCDVYHAVLNSGYSLGTAINFALEPWYECGLVVEQQKLYCRHDVCQKLEGVNPDGSRKDSFYYIVGKRPDGTAFTARMTRSRGVVRIRMHHFAEHMRSMRILGGDSSFYLDGYRPSGIFWASSASASLAFVASAPAAQARHVSSQTSGGGASDGSELALLASAVGHCLAGSSWRLAETPSDDALILAGFVQKAARGSVDVAALVAALRSMSLGQGSAEPAISGLVPRSSSSYGVVGTVASDAGPSASDVGMPSAALNIGGGIPPVLVGRSSVTAVLATLSSEKAPASSGTLSDRVALLPNTVSHRLAKPSSAGGSVLSTANASVLQSCTSVAKAKRPHFIKRTGGAPKGRQYPKGKCHLCGEVFSRAFAAKRHVRRRVCQANAGVLSKLRCARCGCEYRNAGSLRDHVRRGTCGRKMRAPASTSASAPDVAESMLID